MKKLLIAVLGIASILILSLNSCRTDEQQEAVINHQIIKDKSKSIIAKKIEIIHVTWDGEWGRTSKECQGFGLCHFTVCLFCEPKGNSSKIEINNETNEEIMYIELKQDGSKQSEAITDREILYVDEDMMSENVILHKGAYIFDSSIGDYGGYRVNVTLKK